MTNIKNETKNKKPLIIGLIIIGIATLGLLGFSYYTASTNLAQLRQEENSKHNEVIDLEQALLEKQRTDTDNRTTAVYEDIGVDLSDVKTYRGYAESILIPAFEWQNGTEYDKVRDEFIAKFGADNSFTTNYLVENTKVGTGENAINKVDTFGLKCEFDRMNTLTVAKLGNGYKFVSNAVYYIYDETINIDNKTGVTPLMATIEFDVVSDASGELIIENIEGYNTYSSIDDGVLATFGGY